MEGLGAGTARIDTLLHIAKLFARSRTLDTNFFAYLADMLGVLRLQEHEMRGHPANFCSGLRWPRKFGQGAKLFLD